MRPSSIFHMRSKQPRTELKESFRADFENVGSKKWGQVQYPICGAKQPRTELKESFRHILLDIYHTSNTKQTIHKGISMKHPKIIFLI